VGWELLVPDEDLAISHGCLKSSCVPIAALTPRRPGSLLRYWMQVLGTGWDKTVSNALDVRAELPEELFVGELLLLNRLVGLLRRGGSGRSLALR